MVVDSLDNIEIYKGLSPDIYEGLKFLKNAKPDIALGEYSVNKRLKAIVSDGDKILVKGSRGMEMEIIVEAMLQT